MATVTITLPGAITDPTGFQTLNGTSVTANPETTAYQTRMAAAGYTLSINEITAFDTFITSLKTANVWDSVMELYPIYGDNLAQAGVKLKQDLVASDISVLSAGNPYTAYDNAEVVGGKVVGFIPVGGEEGGSPSGSGHGKALNPGFDARALFTKTAGYQNQNNRAFGMTFIGDDGYTIEGGYSTIFGGNVLGYQEVDGVTQRCVQFMSKSTGQITAYPFTVEGLNTDGWDASHRFFRAATNGTTGYSASGVLGSTITQDSEPITRDTYSRDDTPFLIMGVYLYTSSGATTPVFYSAARRFRCRMLILDDGSNNTQADWQAANAAIDTLFTALGKNTW